MSTVPTLDEFSELLKVKNYTRNVNTKQEKIEYLRRLARSEIEEVELTSAVDAIVVDNSKWCTPVKIQPQQHRQQHKRVVSSDTIGTNQATAFKLSLDDLVEYSLTKVYDEMSVSYITFKGVKCSYVKRDPSTFSLVKVKDISDDFGEFITSETGKPVQTIIMNNNLIEFTLTTLHGERIIEGLECVWYDNDTGTVLADVADDHCLYYIYPVGKEIKSGQLRVAEAYVRDRMETEGNLLVDWTSADAETSQFKYMDTAMCPDISTASGTHSLYSHRVYNNKTNIFRQLESLMIRYKNMFHDYYLLEPSIDVVRSFIDNGYAVLIELVAPVNTSLNMWGAGKTEVQYFLIVGYDNTKKMFKLKGTRGTSYGNDGYTQLPYDDMSYPLSTLYKLIVLI
jgi:hypothetical protein